MGPDLCDMLPVSLCRAGAEVYRARDAPGAADRPHCECLGLLMGGKPDFQYYLKYAGTFRRYLDNLYVILLYLTEKREH